MHTLKSFTSPAGATRLAAYGLVLFASCIAWQLPLARGLATEPLSLSQPDPGSPPSPKPPVTPQSQPATGSVNVSLAAPPTSSSKPAQKAPQKTSVASVQVTSQGASDLQAASQVSVGPVSPPVRELSVQPGSSQPLLPVDHPAWIVAPADYSGSIHRLVVGSLITDSADDVDLMLDEPLIAAVNEYIDNHVLEAGAGQLLQSKITANYVRRNLINDPAGYVAELNMSAGPMYQKWVAVSVTAAQREQIAEWHREAIQRRRLAPIGLGLAGVLGLIGLSNLVLRRFYSLPVTTPVSRPIELASAPPIRPVASAPQSRRCRRWPVFKLVFGLSMLLLLLAFVLPALTIQRAGNDHREQVIVRHLQNAQSPFGQPHNRTIILQSRSTPSRAPRPPLPPAVPHVDAAEQLLEVYNANSRIKLGKDGSTSELELYLEHR